LDNEGDRLFQRHILAFDHIVDGGLDCVIRLDATPLDQSGRRHPKGHPRQAEGHIAMRQDEFLRSVIAGIRTTGLGPDEGTDTVVFQQCAEVPGRGKDPSVDQHEQFTGKDVFGHPAGNHVLVIEPGPGRKILHRMADQMFHDRCRAMWIAAVVAAQIENQGADLPLVQQGKELTQGFVERSGILVVGKVSDPQDGIPSIF